MGSGILSTIIWLLVICLVIGLAYIIIKNLIMPAIPAPMQVWVWAIIGILLLLVLAGVILQWGPMHLASSGPLLRSP
jgi:hypothetical protein